MKLIHCADLHLDSQMNANLDKAKAKERKTELLLTFQRMLDYAEQNGVAAILIAGDLFDTRQVSVTARNAVYQGIAGHPDIEFFYLQGNHDADSFLAGLETLPPNLNMFGENWTSYSVGAEGRVVITGVELNRENHKQIYNALVLDGSKINIVLLHGQEAEYQAKNKAECIHLAELRNKGIDYLALGHIHGYKEEVLDSRGSYCYPGCLEGRGFDECGEHGFVLLEVDETEGRINRRFVPFASRRLYSVPVDISDCRNTPDIRDRIQEVLDREKMEESSLVEIVLCGSVDVECDKNTEFLTKQFEERFYALKIKDKTKIAVDYQAFQLDASLKGEFVRTVMEGSLDEDLKGEIIRCGIKALAGEAIDE